MKVKVNKYKLLFEIVHTRSNRKEAVLRNLHSVEYVVKHYKMIITIHSYGIVVIAVELFFFFSF